MLKKHNALKWILFLLIALVAAFFLYKTSASKITSPQDLRNTELTGEQSTRLSESEAIKIISELPEVEEFQELLEKDKKSVYFQAFDEGGYWNIKVYEDVKDSETEGHTATFNFYNVDKNTREVTK